MTREIVLSLRDLDRDGFVIAMARRLEDRSTLKTLAARSHAVQVLDDFLAAEQIEFGDPAYDWTAAGAVTLADEELEFFEAAA